MIPTHRRDVVELTYDISGVPDIVKRYAKTKAFRPDRLLVMFVNGELASFTVAGPRVMKNGLSSNRESETYRSWDTYPGETPSTPSWVRPYVNRLPKPLILVTRDDLLRILAGSEMGCGGPGNAETSVLIRMFTAEELLEAHRLACEEYGAPTTMTREQALSLTTRVDLLREV